MPVVGDAAGQCSKVAPPAARRRAAVRPARRAAYSAACSRGCRGASVSRMVAPSARSQSGNSGCARRIDHDTRASPRPPLRSTLRPSTNSSPPSPYDRSAHASIVDERRPAAAPRNAEDQLSVVRRLNSNWSPRRPWTHMALASVGVSPSRTNGRVLVQQFRHQVRIALADQRGEAAKKRVAVAQLGRRVAPSCRSAFRRPAGGGGSRSGSSRAACRRIPAPRKARSAAAPHQMLVRMHHTQS